MKKIRVLIADDHQGIRNLMVSHLSRDFQVIGCAGNGEELVDLATRVPPDVIVSDISMPVMDGPVASQKLADAGFFIPFVFVSTESSDVIELLADRFEGSFVFKPEMCSHLSRAVQAAVEGQSYLSPYYRRSSDEAARAECLPPTHEAALQEVHLAPEEGTDSRMVNSEVRSSRFSTEACEI